MAFELAQHDPLYETMIVKFVEHFYFIASAMNTPGSDGMWDEEDGFYYDLLRLPDGSGHRLKVRSLVGLLPLCATIVIEKEHREKIPKTMARILERLRRIPELQESIHPTGPGHYGEAERGILALVKPERLRRILSRMLDEKSFSDPMAFVRSQNSMRRIHMYFMPTVRNTGWITFRQNRIPECLAAIPIGAVPSGCLLMPCLSGHFNSSTCITGIILKLNARQAPEI